MTVNPPASNLPLPQQQLHVEIKGAVQGVGFRPFVYRLATELALTGWVINNTKGVFIEVEGDETALDQFLVRLSKDKPPRAIILSLNADRRPLIGYTQFEIRHSDEHGAKTVFVLPDIATCPDCLAELFDPADRRCGYPFTNCTNCGPRFSILQLLPYDRPNTTMRHFIMCPNCQTEYEDPLDRRFHAQPNACPVCGPQLDFQLPVDDVDLQLNNKWSTCSVNQVVDHLLAGKIIAVKGLGGFHLMVDAANSDAVARLRERKYRYGKPLAVMARDLTQAKTLCHISPAAEKLLTSAEAPIVLLQKQPNVPIAKNVAPDNPCLGIMLPYTPLHHLLLRQFNSPVVATSGNLSDEPICIDNNQAQQRLENIADLFLFHNRPIERHVDDSVTWLLEEQPRLLRRARGYAPLPVQIPQKAPTILAVGAHLKNSVALSVEQNVFISQHIGDLETAESMAAFERVIVDFLRLYEAAPVAVAHDMHPDYLSTRWAQNNLQVINDNLNASNKKQTSGENLADTLLPPPKIGLIPVQHHHAHLASCLAENKEAGPALGVIWDGTGYGPDGTIWGGEFLLGDAAGFKRVAHLRPFLLPGGDAAVKEPRRVALALLWELYGDAALKRDGLAPIRAFTSTEQRLLGQMLSKKFNTPLTTSAGRLFDGVVALMGLHQTVNFEGQAAMALEFMADTTTTEAYPLLINHQQPVLVLDWQPLVEAVLDDLRQGVKAGIIAARFHNALVKAIVSVAKITGHDKVALSGGCFQNRLLTERTADHLRKAGFKVLLHKEVPPNDGGISLGQIAVAAAHLKNANLTAV